MADADIVASIEFEDEINFIEVDAEEIQNRIIEDFEEYTGEVLYPGDERRLYLQGMAYLMASVVNYVNETGRGNLLRYAEEMELDGIGDLFTSSRLSATYAKTTMQITLAEAQTKNIEIPAGTRVTDDGTHFFTLDTDVVFLANTTELVQVVDATAVEAGVGYNDLLPGQINKIVDSQYGAYIEKIENITTSSGGTDTENDKSYRERLRIEPFSLSVAGPSEAYRAIALSVSNAIQDVNPYSPSAGVVEIPVVLVGGIIPDTDDELLTEIYTACSAKTARPMTDNVRVVPATGVNTTINVKYYVKNNDMSAVPAIMAAVEEYKKWQTGKIKRDINPDELRRLMYAAGAARVDITTPVSQTLADNQVAQITDTVVSYGGSVNV